MLKRKKIEQSNSYETLKKSGASFEPISIGVLGSADKNTTTDEYEMTGMLLKDVSGDDYFRIEKLVLEGIYFFISLTYSDVANGRLHTSQEFVDVQKLNRAQQSFEQNHNEYGIGTLVFRKNSKGKEVVELILIDGNHRTAISLMQRNPIRILIANTWNMRDNAESKNPNKSNIVLGFNHIIKEVRRLLDIDQY